MHRVLIVAPHFPPVNAADAHRARTLLPELAGTGWEARVLAVDPRDVVLARDDELERALPPAPPVERVRAWPPAACRRLGLGSLALRARGALRRTGDRLVRDYRPDVVFFSTTEYPLLTLGLRWRRRFGVPFVADWQDPWLTDYYDRTGTPPPGGRVKFAVSQWLARRGEPRVVRGAAHLVSVSAAYIAELARRYPDWDAAQRSTVLPFGAPARDFAWLDRAGIRPPELGFAPGAELWVYAGRGGPDLARSARAFFLAVQRDRAARPDRWQRRRILCVGTSYAPPPRATATLAPLAAACGVADLVTELPARQPYFATLALLRSAARIVVLGSDDPAYNASKVLPCLLAGPPLLALLRAESGAAGLLRATGGAALAGFTARDSADELAAAVAATGIFDDPCPVRPADPAALAPHTAAAMTARLAGLFDAARAAAA